jgi:hypothetical protein
VKACSIVFHKFRTLFKWREKIYTRRKRGRPKVRWLDDIQEDIERWGLKDGEGELRIGTSGGK